MKLYELINQLYTALREKTAQSRIVLLHPDSRYRSALVARLIHEPNQRVFYYAMGTDDLDLQSFIAGITHDLANQHPLFGRHTHMLLQKDPSNFTKLLDTFSRDVAELSEDPFILILDEYDRTDGADDIQMFIERLVMRLPERCQIVINSRTLPRMPWVSMIARKHAIMMLDDQMIMGDFYRRPSEGKHDLDVYALGPGFVIMNDKPIEAWEGHLPRLLFFFALDKAVVTRSEICHAFWPELDMDQAVNVFHVTKRRLHKAFDMDVLVHDEGYYQINPELVIHFDALNFTTALVAARTDDSPKRMDSWQRAIDLYRGPFLQGHSDNWIENRRYDFRVGLLEALTSMAQIRLGQDRPEQALSLFQRALGEDNLREDIHREVMQLLGRMGRRSEVAAHYQRLMDELKKQGRQAEPETSALYAKIVS
jgi:DNA-binding SARP family transcriptional activator